jgi:hypothetical protein
MAAATLDGDKVLSSEGDDIGKIKDIMLDVRSGRIAYAVLSSGGFLGIGDMLLAIPWHALTLDTERKCFQLAMSSERVKNAPGFDKDLAVDGRSNLGHLGSPVLRQRTVLGARRSRRRRDPRRPLECTGSWRREVVTAIVTARP